MMNIGVARQMLSRCRGLVQSAKWREAPEAIERLLARVEQLASSENYKRPKLALIDAAISLHKARCYAYIFPLCSTKENLAWLAGLTSEREQSARMLHAAFEGLVKSIDEAGIALDRARADVKTAKGESK